METHKMEHAHNMDHSMHNMDHSAHQMEHAHDHANMMHADAGNDHADHTAHAHHDHAAADPDVEKEDAKTKGMHDMHAMHHASPDRPFWVAVAIGVSHCGAGCVLGDIVGEWVIFGTNAQINGKNIWPELLVDYGFALLFGIAFQYFSIAPMSGDYGWRSLVRAAKADILSLTFFEVGLFGWMLIYQIGIWDYKLMTNTYLYWWQMQVCSIDNDTAHSLDWHDSWIFHIISHELVAD
jgi:hypothetical protein